MTPPTPSRAPNGGLRALLLALAFLFAGPPAVVSAAPVAAHTAPVAAAAPVFADGWSVRKLYAPFEGILGNRTRMIQFCMLAMCIALYIIWWRK
jgi:hypothetical protein